MLADAGSHRAPSVADLIVAATAERAGPVVLHVAEVFVLVAGGTGRVVEDLAPARSLEDPHDGRPVADHPSSVPAPCPHLVVAMPAGAHDHHGGAALRTLAGDTLVAMAVALRRTGARTSRTPPRPCRASPRSPPCPSLPHPRRAPGRARDGGRGHRPLVTADDRRGPGRARRERRAPASGPGGRRAGARARPPAPGRARRGAGRRRASGPSPARWSSPAEHRSTGSPPRRRTRPPAGVGRGVGPSASGPRPGLTVGATPACLGVRSVTCGAARGAPRGGGRSHGES